MTNAVVRNLRFDGGGTLTFLEGRARRHIRAGEAFSVDDDDLADALLADPSVVDLDNPQADAEPDGEGELEPEGTGYNAMSVPMLKELADKRGLDVPSKAKKADLVAAHMAADEAGSTADAEPAAAGPEPTSDAVEPAAAASGGAVTLGDLPDSAKVKS